MTNARLLEVSRYQARVPSKDELMEFPDPVRKEMGHALHLAQTGDKADSAKPLHGFGGAGVLEIVDDQSGATYRAVYTVMLAGTVDVLHSHRPRWAGLEA